MTIFRPKISSCKVTWATKWLSSLYEIAQVSLQVQSKDCLKVRIFFSSIYKHFFFVIRILFIISFQIKKKIEKKVIFFHSKKSNNEI
jgi:hypothetical protein